MPCRGQERDAAFVEEGVIFAVTRTQRADGYCAFGGRAHSKCKRMRNHFAVFAHSHSMVAGGFAEMRQTTRLTPGPLLQKRAEAAASSCLF